VGKDLVAVLRAPAVLGALEAAAAGAVSPEVTVELSGETPRTFAARFQALDRAESSGGTMVLVLHDISEMWRTERLRADFVANASHEIRTPLSTLVGAVETMQGPARDDAEARDKFLALMQDQAGRIKSLVDDLLSLSRIERSEHDAPSATVELASILDLARGSLDWKAQDRNVSVVVDVPAAAVVGDPDDLRQLFENLIDNAIKYGSRDGTVSITVGAVPADTVIDGWRARGHAVAVAVRDNGPGIPSEHLPRLTERFYRVDKARSRQMGGTGLGLAIVKHLVSRHRGTMTIESEPGQGSCFTVYLNRADLGGGGGNGEG
jgi:two-component system phosphate regulon sensor histidine kinase PhoR